MTKEQLTRITRERLEKWSRICIENLGTPIVLLAVSNNPVVPEPFLCMMEGISDSMLTNLLLHVIAQLKTGDVRKN